MSFSLKLDSMNLPWSAMKDAIQLTELLSFLIDYTCDAI